MTTIKKPWYDDPVEMLKYTADLASFSELGHARFEACREYKEANPKGNHRILTRYIVRGIWELDEAGGVCTVLADEVRRGKSGNYKRIDLQPLREQNIVQTIEEFCAWLGDPEAQYSIAYGARNMPYADTPCDCCGKLFTMATSFDAVAKKEQTTVSLAPFVGKTLSYVRDNFTTANGKAYVMDYSIPLRHDRFIDLTPIEHYGRQTVVNKEGWAQAKDRTVTPPFSASIHYDDYLVQEGDDGGFTVSTYYHSQCLLIKLTQQVRYKVMAAFTTAGIAVYGSIAVANRYGSESYAGKWLIFDTDKGYFQIGWRKRVLKMHPVTIENDMIVSPRSERHFHSYDDLAQHLKSHYNTVTDVMMAVRISQDVPAGETSTCLYTREICKASIAALEEMLTRLHIVSFDGNAEDIVSVRPLLPDDVRPDDWEEAYGLFVGNKQIGHVSRPVES